MRDLISRQAAIDALRVAYWDDNIQSAKDDPCIVDAMTDWAIRQVKALPPAQPESLVNESRPLVKDLVKDTISRQAAIDALRTCYDTETITMDNGDEYINYGDAVGEIEQLPPIQPKRGRWIKTARWGRVYYCDQCRNYLDFDGVNVGRGSANFCPNCGTEMEETDG